MGYKTVLVDTRIEDRLAFEVIASAFDDLELVCACASASEAVAYAKGNQVDVVFTEITLSEDDGLLLIDRMRLISRSIVAVAMSSDEWYMIDAISEHQADAFVPKPLNYFQFKSIWERIKHLVAGDEDGGERLSRFPRDPKRAAQGSGADAGMGQRQEEDAVSGEDVASDATLEPDETGEAEGDPS